MPSAPTPNRSSGEWLKGKEGCPQRVEPCGNPWDADEAMRSGQIESGSNSFLANQQSSQAFRHAEKIAERCEVPEKDCPIAIAFDTTKAGALKEIKKSVK